MRKRSEVPVFRVLVVQEGDGGVRWALGSLGSDLIPSRCFVAVLWSRNGVYGHVLFRMSKQRGGYSFGITGKYR